MRARQEFPARILPPILPICVVDTAISQVLEPRVARQQIDPAVAVDIDRIDSSA
jgi:hypothetical protein